MSLWDLQTLDRQHTCHHDLYTRSSAPLKPPPLWPHLTLRCQRPLRGASLKGCGGGGGVRALGGSQRTCPCGRTLGMEARASQGQAQCTLVLRSMFFQPLLFFGRADCDLNRWFSRSPPLISVMKYVGWTEPWSWALILFHIKESFLLHLCPETHWSVFLCFIYLFIYSHAITTDTEDQINICQEHYTCLISYFTTSNQHASEDEISWWVHRPWSSYISSVFAVLSDQISVLWNYNLLPFFFLNQILSV